MTVVTQKQLNEAVKVLKQGGVVAFPTDTSYGLAADVTNPQAIDRLYALKGKAFNRPIHVIPPSISYVRKVAMANAAASKLMKTFWPGPLTLVLPLKIRDALLNRIKGAHGLGFRWPDNRIALGLAKKLGAPITATSANKSGQPDNYSVRAIKKQFMGSRLEPDYYMDGGRLEAVIPSTIVFLDNKRVTILRKGPITERAINEAIGK